MFHKKFLILLSISLSLLTNANTNADEERITNFINQKINELESRIQENFITKSQAQFLTQTKSNNLEIGNKVIGDKIADNNGGRSENSFAVGLNNSIFGVNSTILGLNNTIGDINHGTFSLDNRAMASHILGKGNFLFGSNSVILGNDIKINEAKNPDYGHDLFVLGAQINSENIKDAIILGKGSNGVNDALSIGSNNKKRKIVFVEDGDISANSSDAITGKQLYSPGNIDVNAWKNKLGMQNLYVVNDSNNNPQFDLLNQKTNNNVWNDTSDESFAIGWSNNIISKQNNNRSTKNVVIGKDNKISGDYNYVLGNNIEALNVNNALILGSHSTGVSNALSIGSNDKKRKIVFVGDGDISANSSDAITGTQLYSFANNPTGISGFNVNNWRNALNLNLNLLDEGHLGLINQKGSDTDSYNKVWSNDSSDDSFAFGYNNSVVKKFGNARSSKSYIFGRDNNLSGELSMILGNKSILNGNNSVILGNNNNVNNQKNSEDNGHDVYILGSNITVSDIKDAIILGNQSTAVKEALSIGSNDKKRKIVFVKDGDISANSSDAITGKQLYSPGNIDVAAWRTKLNIHDAQNNNNLDNYYNKTEVDTKLDEKLNKTDFVKSNIQGDNIINVSGEGHILDNDIVLSINDNSISKSKLNNELIDNIDNKVNKDASNLEKKDVNNWREKLGILEDGKIINNPLEVDYSDYDKTLIELGKDDNKTIIRNVANPIEKYDAVNKDYVDTIKDNINNEIVDLKRNSAISSAISNIPSISSNSVISIGVGVSRASGKNAVAFGLGGNIENGLIGYKASVGLSEGKVQVGAGFNINISKNEIINMKNSNNENDELIKLKEKYEKLEKENIELKEKVEILFKLINNK